MSNFDKLKKDDEMWLDASGVSWESPQDYLQCEILKFCGCGNPDEVMEYVKIMLQKLKNQEWGDYEDMGYMFFVYWANDKDFAEHGSSAGCSWLTPKGEELLADIELCERDVNKIEAQENGK